MTGRTLAVILMGLLLAGSARAQSPADSLEILATVVELYAAEEDRVLLEPGWVRKRPDPDVLGPAGAWDGSAMARIHRHLVGRGVGNVDLCDSTCGPSVGTDVLGHSPVEFVAPDTALVYADLIERFGEGTRGGTVMSEHRLARAPNGIWLHVARKRFLMRVFGTYEER